MDERRTFPEPDLTSVEAQVGQLFFSYAADAEQKKSDIMQEDICCASTFATFSCIGFILLVIVLFQK
jgi:hypothetical protein